MGARSRFEYGWGFACDSSSDVGGVSTVVPETALALLELLAVVLVVRMLVRDGVGDGLRMVDGVVGTSN